MEYCTSVGLFDIGGESHHFPRFFQIYQKPGLCIVLLKLNRDAVCGGGTGRQLEKQADRLIDRNKEGE
jgi:hypothetical protein